MSADEEDLDGYPGIILVVSPPEDRPPPDDPVDFLVSAGVRDRLGYMQGTAGLMTHRDTKAAEFANTRDAVATIEEAIGRELPKARSELERIRSDGWTGLT